MATKKLQLINKLVGIHSVEPVATSTEDGGKNIHRIKMTNGSTYDIEIQNGKSGKDGTGVTILGSYTTEEALRTAHPTGSAGDSYLVAGYLYVWSETERDWKNVGQIQGPIGPKGDKGDKGDTGSQGPQGVSGVYVGSGSMPSGYNIQIDPESDDETVVGRDEFELLVNDVNQLSTQIGDLQENGVTGEAIPNYVIEEAESTITKVFTHGNLGRIIRFIAISDTHEDSAQIQNPQITISNKHAGQAIKYIADRIGIDFIAHLGDASSCGAWSTTYEPNVLRNDIMNINNFVFSDVRDIKRVFIVGNHDMISMNGYSLLNSGAYSLFGNMCSGNKDRLGGWGYFDIDDAKVRVIYLNTSDSPSSAAYLTLTQSQKNWLCETLIDVNAKDNADEWKVILLSHAPLDFGGANISTEILLPYVNGGNYNSYNFNGKNEAKIISNIHGHVHCFSYGYIADTIRRFAIPNACYIGANHYASRTDYADWADTTTYNKTANSGKDTSFSLVTIDLDSSICYVDNYGAGIDREFSIDYSQEQEQEPTVLLNLDREYVSGTTDEYLYDSLDENKAYLNVGYTNLIFANSSGTVSNITENSVTYKEPGIGGITVAYPIYLPDITKNSYKITFDYSGTGKCRSYYRYAINGVPGGNNNLFIDDTAGASGSVDVTIPPNTDGYTWLIIILSSNTSGTKTFTNVKLTKVD